jgi:hypothetical protein
LRGETPALEILPDQPVLHLHREADPHQVSECAPRRERERQGQLCRARTNDLLPHPNLMDQS